LIIQKCDVTLADKKIYKKIILMVDGDGRSMGILGVTSSLFLFVLLALGVLFAS
jgi:hypothetical protein